MKKILAIILTVVMISSLAACGAKRESAQAVVETAMTAIQKYDKEAMERYLGSNEIEDEVALGDEDEDSEMMAESLLSAMTYKVAAATEDEKAGTATVSVDITNTDMSAVMSDFMGSMFAKAMEYAILPVDQQPSEDEMNAMYLDEFTSMLESSDYGTVTATVDIGLTLIDDQWVITSYDGLIDAILGGMVSSMDAMSGALSDMG